jgi:hypothetical protein
MEENILRTVGEPVFVGSDMGCSSIEVLNDLEYIGNRLEIEEQCGMRLHRLARCGKWTGSVPVKKAYFTTEDTEEILNRGEKSGSCECDKSCNAELRGGSSMVGCSSRRGPRLNQIA